MTNILNILQMAVAVLLIVTILFQKRGAGLGGAFGGGGGGGDVYFKKRGAEKFLSIFTIILATLFILSAIIRMVV